jgi:hypothetical protein
MPAGFKPALCLILTRASGVASHGRASGRFHSGAACFHFSFTPAGVFSRSRAADADKALDSFHGI